MSLIRLLALQALLLPATAFASTCLLEIDCDDHDQHPEAKTEVKTESKTEAKTGRAPPSTYIPHDHNDPQHRWQIIMESHEFASKTCSYDVNCDSDYRCDLQPGFHKGICLRKR
ncbi:MAG: hypothetical protein ACJAWL_000155 [Motiliproteus sp.]|jgi:hypothetical protein